MPIQFRCTTCNQLLSISRKKAGVEILCPKCTTLTRVPQLPGAGDDDPPVEKPATPPKAVASAPAERTAPRKQREVFDPPPVSEQPAASLRPLTEARRLAPDPGPAPSEQRVLDEIDAIDGLITSEVEDDTREFLRASHGGLSSLVPSLPYNPWTDIDHDEDEYHPTKRQQPPKDELDMTSLVDVTFLLLVFFMITASFTVQKFLQIAAPESDDNAAATAIVSNDDIVGESVVVAVDAQDRITVDDAPVASLADLKKLLENKLRDEQKTDVLIEAEYHATHGTCVAVTDMAIQAGMLHVRRASRRDSDE